MLYICINIRKVVLWEYIHNASVMYIVWRKGVGTIEKYELIIYEMRQALYTLIDKKENLLDMEVIAASQELDKVLNEYNIIQSRLLK
ncbi:Spo0E like sporulation regulatory protein [Clostridium beijerinckii]|nr:Spo0E like sporulation regulatory protein [Clostridium beijerinckii]OOM68582.1 Spo0E like sporulation regulatory protein [Clostridium beijerinckii]CUU46965.1 Sporulation stage 0, Spo0E-like regulatory phosphatase (modular protein) [Clostridium beijerinckii]